VALRNKTVLLHLVELDAAALFCSATPLGPVHAGYTVECNEPKTQNYFKL